MLKDDGKGVIVLPLGTLFKDSTKHIRQKMIEEGIIEGLVLLPDNMFMTTGIPVVLWIINKDKTRENKDKIFMINAKENLKFGNKMKQLKFILIKKKLMDFPVIYHLKI